MAMKVNEFEEDGHGFKEVIWTGELPTLTEIVKAAEEVFPNDSQYNLRIKADQDAETGRWRITMREEKEFLRDY